MSSLFCRPSCGSFGQALPGFKLGMPGHEKFDIGAIATGGVRVLNEQVINEVRYAKQNPN